eukprot:TRINITY_DN72582_c0_g1_i1.p1 TRINITY_DN72582_c0_g1~~TRINITY_DN72582_c0_g1_i1.p1  ORF type:complete len:716 (+),score=87.04 TRINITY_DN72582_c0_g1_i1:116-2149(+)
MAENPFQKFWSRLKKGELVEPLLSEPHDPEEWELQFTDSGVVVRGVYVPARAYETAVAEHCRLNNHEPVPIEHCVGPAVPWAWLGVKVVWGSLFVNLLVLLAFSEEGRGGIYKQPMVCLGIAIVAALCGAYCDIRCMRFSSLPWLQQVGKKGPSIMGMPLSYKAFMMYARFMSVVQMVCIHTNALYAVRTMMSSAETRPLFTFVEVGSLHASFISPGNAAMFCFICELAQVIIPVLIALPYPFKRVVNDTIHLKDRGDFERFCADMYVDIATGDTQKNRFLRSVQIHDSVDRDITQHAWGKGYRRQKYPLTVKFERVVTPTEYEELFYPKLRSVEDIKNTAYTWRQYLKMWLERSEDERRQLKLYRTPAAVKEKLANSSISVLRGDMAFCRWSPHEDSWHTNFGISSDPAYYTSIGVEWNATLITTRDRQWSERIRRSDKKTSPKPNLSFYIFPQEAVSLLGGAIGMKAVGSIDVTYRLEQVSDMYEQRIGFNGPNSAGWEYRCILRLQVLHRIVEKRLVIGLLLRQSLMMNLQVTMNGLERVLQGSVGRGDMTTIINHGVSIAALMITTLLETSVVLELVKAFWRLSQHVMGAIKGEDAGYPSTVCRVGKEELRAEYNKAWWNTFLLIVTVIVSAAINFDALLKFVGQMFICSSGLFDVFAGRCLECPPEICGASY